MGNNVGRLVGSSSKDIIDLNWPQINVIIGRSRTMDHNWASDTITVLRAEVRVVPRCAVVGSDEFVDLGITWCKSALSDTVDTVLVIGIELTHAVPVNGGTVVGQVVGNLDTDCVTPVALNERTWILTIDGQCKSRSTVEIEGGVGDVEIECTDSAIFWPCLEEIRVDVETTAPLISRLGVIAATVTFDRLLWDNWYS